MNPAVDPDVVAAGRRVFEQVGYHGATVERIAQEAGLSRVTLHRRGVNKDVVLEAMATEAVQDYRERLWPALVSPGSGASRLEQAFGALLDAAEVHMALLLAVRSQSDAIFHEDGTPEALTRTVFTEPIEQLLREGQADGTLRVDDPEGQATVLFNLVGWTYIHLRDGHRWSQARARGSVLDLALNGIATGGQAIHAGSGSSSRSERSAPR